MIHASSYYICRLTFPSVLILYQDIVVSLHGVNLFIGYADRRLYCPDEDLIVAYEAPATPYCTISGILHNRTFAFCIFAIKNKQKELECI